MFLTIRLCSFARRNVESSFIAVESEETDSVLHKAG